MGVELENLVVLRYAGNPCYPDVLSFGDAKKWSDETEGFRGIYDSLSVDVEKGTWKFRGEERQIGTGKYYGSSAGCEYLIRGVYNRTNTAHLNHMAHDAAELVRD